MCHRHANFWSGQRDWARVWRERWVLLMVCAAGSGIGSAGDEGAGLAGAEGGEEVGQGVEAVGADYGVAVGPGGGHAADFGAVAG